MNNKPLMLMLTGIALLSLPRCSQPDNGPLRVAGLENVTVGGELGRRIDRNFDRMETEYYQPAQVYWTEQESGGWPADKEGRTILALVMDGRASHREPKYLAELLRLLPERLNAKGYLGPIHEGSVDEQQLSGHGWLLRGLCEYYAWKKDTAALRYAKTIVDSLFIPIMPFVDSYPLRSDQRVAGVGDMSGSVQNTVNGWALSSDIGCVFIGMEGLIHAYRYLPDEQAKQLIDKLIGLFQAMDLTGIKAQTHASLTAMRGMLRYAGLTGDTTLLPEVEKRWEQYKRYGMTENYENYNWFERYDTWTEPCAIIDSYLVATQLWMATRRSAYLEDAETIYLNGMACTQRANGGFGCDKPVGEVFPALSVHADEAYWCCTMRGGEGLGRAAEYTYFTEGDKVYLPFYRESVLSLPEKGLALEQRTEYPFGDRVEVTVTEAPARPVTLALAAPSYLRIGSLTVNGEEAATDRADGFVELQRTYRKGDRIVLEYAFDTRWEPLGNADIADKTLYKAMYGPLVLGYDAPAPIELHGRTAIVPKDGYTFQIEGTPYRLRPLYHLMDPQVSSGTDYRKGVVARIL